MARLPWRKAASILNLAPTALYREIVAQRLPATRIGGPRGRWIVDTELCETALRERMLSNIQNAYAAEPSRIRQVQP